MRKGSVAETRRVVTLELNDETNGLFPGDDASRTGACSLLQLIHQYGGNYIQQQAAASVGGKSGLLPVMVVVGVFSGSDEWAMLMREAARETWIHDVQDSRSSSEVIVHFLVRGADKLLGFWSFRVFKFNSTKCKCDPSCKLDVLDQNHSCTLSHNQVGNCLGEQTSKELKEEQLLQNDTLVLGVPCEPEAADRTGADKIAPSWRDVHLLQAWLRWVAARFDFKYAVKADQRTFLRMPVILHHLSAVSKTTFYWGRIHRPKLLLRPASDGENKYGTRTNEQFN
eukprot:359006-Prorocentrum_minimum.AAC.2